MTKYVISFKEYQEGFTSFNPKEPQKIVVNPYNRLTQEQEYESFELGFIAYLKFLKELKSYEHYEQI